MVETTVQLTEEERRRLADIARQTEQSEEEVIREAVSRFIDAFHTRAHPDAIDHAFGLWKNRDDLPDFEKLRREADRLPPRP